MSEQTEIQPHLQSQPKLPETPIELSRSSSKIPVRPNKLRKLSSVTADEENTEDKSSPQHIPGASEGGNTEALTVIEESGAAAAVNATTSRNRRRKISQSARALTSVGRPLSSDNEVSRALNHLRAADPLLVDLIDSLPAPTFDYQLPPFLALTKSILYQQLAYKAGTAVYTRFVELCGGEDGLRPDAVLAISTQQLRQIGVSSRKAVYLYDLANKYMTGILSDDSIVRMDDKSLFAMLSMVKGIGSWSVHMFMIFSLHRPDVLPVSDMGVRKGVQIRYGLEELPKPSQMEQLCENWRPYRSVGSWYMWRLVEGKGTAQVGAAAASEGVLPLQQQIVQQEAGQQHQLQLLQPINGTGNLGACIWGQ